MDESKGTGILKRIIDLSSCFPESSCNFTFDEEFDLQELNQLILQKLEVRAEESLVRLQEITEALGT